MTGALFFWVIVSSVVGGLIMTQFENMSFIHYFVGGLLSSLVGFALAMMNWWYVEQIKCLRYERNPIILGDKDEYND